MDEAQCLSSRSLRYGRNIMVICFVACGVEFFAADFTGARLFGIKVQEHQFWLVLLFLLLWHLIYFVILVNDDIKIWWARYVSRYPTPRFVFYLWKPTKYFTSKDGWKYAIVEHTTQFQWNSQRGKKTTSSKGVDFPVHEQTRRTFFRVLLLDAGAPIMFSLFTIFLVVREWLSLSFWKFVIQTLIG